MFDPATQSSVEEEDDADEEIVAQAVKSKCLNVPKGFLEDPNRVFQCPECLATAPDPGERMKVSPLPPPPPWAKPLLTRSKYHVHRGGRNTRRMTSRSTIVLIVYYLRSLQKLAEAVLMQISSMLGIFELEVSTGFFCPICFNQRGSLGHPALAQITTAPEAEGRKRASIVSPYPPSSTLISGFRLNT